MSKIQVTRLHNLSGHNGPVYALQPSDTASKFFSAAGDGMVVLWDLNDPEHAQLIARVPNSIYAMHYYPDKDVLIAGQNYEGIHLLDWKNKKEIGSLQLTKSSIFDIQSANGLLYVGIGDGVLAVVDFATRTIVEQKRLSEKSVRSISINRETGDIAVGFSDFYIRVYDAALNFKKEWEAHANSIFTVRYSPDFKFLISGSRDARLKIWDVQANYQPASEVVAHLFAINHLEFSPDGKHFVTCSMDKSIKVWDAEEYKLLKVIDKSRHAGHGTSVNKLLWTPFNDQLISASDDRTLSVWQIIF